MPAEPADLASARRAQRKALRRSLRKRAAWQTHYNAACTAGVLMQLHSSDVTKRDADHLPRFAREQLELAILCPGSEVRSAASAWLLDEDPDLEVLRGHQEFRILKVRHFPDAEVRPERPNSTLVHRLEADWHAASVLAQTARHREQRWHRLGHDAEPAGADVHDLMVWWNQEAELWLLLRAVAAEPRHWQTRWALLRGGPACGAIDPVVSPYPRYRAIEHPDLRTLPPGGAQSAAEAVIRSLAESQNWLLEQADAAAMHCAGWLDHLRSSDASHTTTFSSDIVRAMAQAQAGIWQHIADRLLPVGPEVDPDHREPLDHLWGRAAAWQGPAGWRSLIHAGHH